MFVVLGGLVAVQRCVPTTDGSIRMVRVDGVQGATLWIAATELSQRQWDRHWDGPGPMLLNAYSTTTRLYRSRGGVGQSPDHAGMCSEKLDSTGRAPEVCVSLGQACVWLNRLSASAGLEVVYRFPAPGVIERVPGASGYRMPTRREFRDVLSRVQSAELSGHDSLPVEGLCGGVGDLLWHYGDSASTRATMHIGGGTDLEPAACDQSIVRYVGQVLDVGLRPVRSERSGAPL